MTAVLGFVEHDVRPDLNDAEYNTALEKWVAKGAKKHQKPTRSRKDGRFVSGAVLGTTKTLRTRARRLTPKRTS